MAQPKIKTKIGNSVERKLWAVEGKEWASHCPVRPQSHLTSYTWPLCITLFFQLVSHLWAHGIFQLLMRITPGGRHGNPLQYSCLENPLDRGAWWAMVHRVAKSQTRLNTHDKNGRVAIPSTWLCPCLKPLKVTETWPQFPAPTLNRFNYFTSMSLCFLIYETDMHRNTQPASRAALLLLQI